MEDFFDTSFRLLRQRNFLCDSRYIYFRLLKLSLKLGDLCLKNGLFLGQIKLCLLKFLPECTIFTLETLHTFLFIFQRLSELTVPVVEILNLLC